MSDAWWLESYRAAVAAHDAYRNSGDAQFLDRAIERYWTFSDPERIGVVLMRDRPGVLNRLAMAHRDRFAARGDIADLDTAIDISEQRIVPLPQTPDQRVDHLANLCEMLRERYETLGVPQDLRAAEHAGEAAVATGHASPNRLASAQMALAMVWTADFLSTGDLRLLDRAETQLRGCLTAIDDEWRPNALTNLGMIGFLRFQRTHDRRALEHAVALNERGLELLREEGFGRAEQLQNLASVLMLVADVDRDAAAAARGAALYRQACDVAGPGWSRLPLTLDNLGSALHVQYELAGDVGLLVEAVGEKRRAAALMPGHPGILSSLGSSLEQLSVHRPGEVSNEEVRDLYAAAVAVGRRVFPVKALEAASRWARWAGRRGAWSEADEALSDGLAVLHQLVASQSARLHKEVWLSNGVALAGQAAYARARLGEPARSAEALEAGRAVLLSESLERRQLVLGQLDPVEHRELIKDYRRAAWAVEQATYESSGDDAGVAAMERTTQELSRVLALIHAATDDGPHDRPRHDDTGIHPEPVIYVTATEQGGLAIRTDGREAVSIWLPKLTTEALTGQMGRVGRSYQHSRIAPRPWRAALDGITEWLWDVVAGPLLEGTGEQSPRSLAVIPCGLLGLLPMHAAWTRDSTTPTGRRYLLDEARIRYLPRRAFARPVEPVALERATFVQGRDLSDAHHDLAALRELTAAVDLVAPGAGAVAQALGLGARNQLLHFACHGEAAADPLHSGLDVGDERPLQVSDLLAVDLSACHLVVMAACESGRFGLTLPDELVGLPAAFLEAGVTAVVSTLWLVPSAGAAELAARFYRLLAKGIAAAEALRQAQIGVRDTDLNSKRDQLPDLGPLWNQYADGPSLVHAGPDYWAGFQYVG